MYLFHTQFWWSLTVIFLQPTFQIFQKHFDIYFASLLFYLDHSASKLSLFDDINHSKFSHEKSVVSTIFFYCSLLLLFLKHQIFFKYHSDNGCFNHRRKTTLRVKYGQTQLRLGKSSSFVTHEVHKVWWSFNEEFICSTAYILWSISH